MCVYRRVAAYTCLYQYNIGDSYDVNVRLLLSRKICYTWSLSSRGGVVKWIDHLTRNWSVVTLKPTIASSRRLFYSKTLLPFWLSTDLFQERIRA